MVEKPWKNLHLSIEILALCTELRTTTYPSKENGYQKGLSQNSEQFHYPQKYYPKKAEYGPANLRWELHCNLPTTTLSYLTNGNKSG